MILDREDIRTLVKRHTEAFTEKHLYQEPAEFVVAVSKFEIARAEGTDTLEHLEAVVEEMVDMQIIIEIAKVRYGISNELFDYTMFNKMRKNLERLVHGKA